VHNLGGSGIAAPVYFLVGLAAFGTMNAVLAAGARIAAERVVGWNRQLRLTPLSASTYLAVKVLTAYAMALATIGLLYGAGATLGVRLNHRKLARDDRAHPGWPRPLRGPRNPDRATC
jgi:ABC-2 type transport system permease protein